MIDVSCLSPKIDERADSFSVAYHLSPREHEILGLVCGGQHPKAVASLVGCSYASVRTHLRRIYKKVGCSGVRELVVRFFSEARDRAAGP